MAARTVEVGTPLNKTATGQIGNAGDPITLIGFYVNTTSAGTIIFKAVNGSGTALSGTITPPIGFHRYPMDCPGGLHATIGGTLDVTFFTG